MLWKIFAREGEGGPEYARDCYQNRVLVVGWSRLGDLNAIKSPEELKKKLEKGWRREAEATGGMNRIAQWVGSLWSYRTDVGKGHYVICPDSESKQYYVGIIQSKGVYHDTRPIGRIPAGEFVHRRKVKWICVLNDRRINSIWPGGHFGGNQVVSRVHQGSDQFFKVLKRKRRMFAAGSHLPRRPDMEWGKEVEQRAFEWLREQNLNPLDESDQNLGWDISCDDDVYEVKGRKSRRTTVVMSENEWRAAKRLKKRYTVLVFTAANKAALDVAKPVQYCDPASNPESWNEKMRVTYDYYLVE
jgi:hypothetical protein